ncbi:aminotransferase DegT [Hymenobacter qilianensis]|uniref:Aminotransferase DegT n=1 Tax=Hymenobacter qilianensis TaxID=1385715 RepID=A0ACB5PNI3_9BACT|nr:aminotransferase DegT [Hymenobacter qilianensis]
MLELEEKLKAHLGVKHLFFVANGTIALQIAIKALELKGEVITTPFSYVATTSSIVWEGCKPTFVDIQQDTLCLDPQLVEQAITPRTSAILATHVYGNPCDVEAIEAIAQKHQLKVIYDAAHAFGVQYKGQSLLNFGDVSTLSFHATKLFHTGEGGAIITDDDELAHKISYMSNFGHDGPERFLGLGINGKNSELHAAMGLCVLPKVSDLARRRQEISKHYDQLLDGLGLVRPLIAKDVLYNYAYYPVIFPNEEKMLTVIHALNAQQIFPRRYFYPPLSELNYVEKQEGKVAQSISPRILCLPLAHDLSSSSVVQIVAIIKENL